MKAALRMYAQAPRLGAGRFAGSVPVRAAERRPAAVKVVAAAQLMSLLPTASSYQRPHLTDGFVLPTASSAAPAAATISAAASAVAAAASGVFGFGA
ncbi:MAG: hypothetical protein WA555_02525, partial [Candidatus Sulfotelmatobacter sp.]